MMTERGPGSAMDHHPSEGNPVDIFGRRYNVRSEHEPATLQSLARYVDDRMRQISERVAPGDVVSIAVLTALNIADDYYKARKALAQRDNETNEWIRTLARRLDAAVDPNDSNERRAAEVSIRATKSKANEDAQRDAHPDSGASRGGRATR